MPRPPLLLCSLLALAGACRPPDEADPTTASTTPPPDPPERPDTTLLPTAGEPGWLSALRRLDGVAVESLFESADATIVTLSFEQPVDHGRPGGPTFRQRAMLRHRDEHAPNVLSTYGYSLFGAESEVGQLVKGNELELEKRFDGLSVPDDPADLDWSTLTPDQVADDAHSVLVRLNTLYDGPWIGTGGSNGGIDTLSHRMHHPDDFAGTVAFVAPLLTSLDDDRIDAFFTDDVDPTCQAAVEKLQVALLTTLWPDYVAAASDYVAYLDSYYAGSGQEGPRFERIGSLERALQLATIELPFVFWQYRGLPACPLVPDPDLDPAAAVDFGLYDAWIANGTGMDATLAAYGTYFVEVNGYVGYPSIDPTPIAAYVDADLVGPNPELYLPPGAAVPAFDPLGPKLQAWLEDDARDVIVVDGVLDPFTRAAADTSRSDASVLHLQDPDGHHLTRIADLPAAAQDEVLDALADWSTR